MEMDGHERSVNIDSIIKEEGEFLEEEMKRPPLGEKIEEDMREDLEIREENDSEGMDHKHLKSLEEGEQKFPSTIEVKKESKEKRKSEK